MKRTSKESKEEMVKVKQTCVETNTSDWKLLALFKQRVIFPFAHFGFHVHINPKTLDYLDDWYQEQGENLEYLYDDLCDLLNKRTIKNYVIFIGPKVGVFRASISH